jgi:hypothetical protein
MLTLSSIQTSRFQNASGFSTGSSDCLEATNDVIDQLIERGDWKDLLLPIEICIKRGCATFPRFVAEVRKMYSKRHGTIEMRNVWWQFLDTGWRRHWDGWCNEHCGGERQMQFEYRAPTSDEICGTTNYLRFYINAPQDVGATCTVFGRDDNGQPLQTQNGDGSWSMGLTLTAIMPYAQSATFVSHIDRVVMSATQSTKYLYAFNNTSQSLYLLSEYYPSETNPSYLRYRLIGGIPRYSGSTCCSGGNVDRVIALVKIKHVPVSDPTDWIPIDNREALLDGFKAIKLADAYDSAGSDKMWLSAVEKLNRQLENSSPDAQFAASDNTFGDGTCYSNQTF